MSNAKQVVLEGRTADTLPEHVREGIEADHRVKVTVEDRPSQPRFMKFRGVGAYRRTSIEEAVARVRSLRDDWD